MAYFTRPRLSDAYNVQVSAPQKAGVDGHTHWICMRVPMFEASYVRTYIAHLN